MKAAAVAAHARWGKQARRVVNWGVPALLLVIVGVWLTKVGWENIYRSRPGSLPFYLVLLVPFFVQPIADLFIYRNLLGVGRQLPLWIFLRKRCLNSIMLDYSGEVYFFLWARKNLKVKDSTLLHAVKDSSVLSASAGLIVLWVMLLVLLLAGVVKIPVVSRGTWWIVAAGTLPLVFAVALFLGHKKLTQTSRRDMVITFALHFVRALTVMWLEYVCWWLSGALPTSGDCLKFVALRLLVTRLPLVPNKELIFVGVGVAAAGLMNISAPKVAAVLVIMTLIDRLQDIVVVGGPWLWQQLPQRRRAVAP
ncbi:hypothetical protein FHS83_000698 [Rhizomicrobium palustre]|uniref:Flippase-like domain-containing protein n=1 Tax=Rhizomicrobium palustre TaxID=189966 RepID=A0A846MWG9_9PROT|nr:hypothetical protein [Rhizomicrobium palustre]NIK87380.1 hypothetical protein [Rhizomicrobium palustre]